MSTKRDALSSLYAALKARQDLQRGAAPAVRERPQPERLAYHAEANRASRLRAKAERTSSARPRPTKANVRAALADAALMLLATGGPGSAEVKSVLGTAFGQAGLPLALEAKARSGELRPTLLTPERLRAPEAADERPGRIRSRRGL